jgi:hypothetical protein
MIRLPGHYDRPGCWLQLGREVRKLVGEAIRIGLLVLSTLAGSLARVPVEFDMGRMANARIRQVSDAPGKLPSYAVLVSLR